ncbi:hypothetical protein EW093_05415 [Thiospirochaeta perfilievii]|uniref:Uncharacterized protein n=1 Tax=Thiospirochaeta perfilievii TaxID=252967 RepID=A0A5C1QBX7_9SPIO|nr:hypothetical protein [Thiospirochaeta perfilievii]QEN04164.1 hypothetical protein EW093_05415 [Thiospirochaeta perfilievii]
MQFRPYGDTGRVLSCLGVDISNNIKNQHQYNSILKKSLERGINYIQFDYKVFRKFINLKEGLDKARKDNSVDIGIVVPSNIIKIKNILKVATKSLDITSVDFLIIQGSISDSFLITKILSYLKKDNRVRHVIASISDVNKDIYKLENTEGLDGVNFSGDAVLKALKKDYMYNSHKGTTVKNIFSGDKYKAKNSLIFIAKALSISDINIVTHRFINAKEVDFVIDFIEKEDEFKGSDLTDEDILKYVERVEYYQILKGQRSPYKKMKSLFRKKRHLLDV